CTGDGHGNHEIAPAETALGLVSIVFVARVVDEELRDHKRPPPDLAPSASRPLSDDAERARNPPEEPAPHRGRASPAGGEHGAHRHRGEDRPCSSPLHATRGPGTRQDGLDLLRDRHQLITPGLTKGTPFDCRARLNLMALRNSAGASTSSSSASN